MKNKSVKVRGFWFATIIVIVAAGFNLTAHARSGLEYSTPIDNLPRHFDNKSALDEDSIDPHTGNLKVHQVDLSIPGPKGLDITVRRTYDLFNLSAGLRATFKRSYEWAALGPGWKIAVAPKIYLPLQPGPNVNRSGGSGRYPENALTNLCAGKGLPWSLTKYSEFMLEQSDGSTASFFWSAPYEARTQDNWKLRCDAQNLMLYSPSGIAYDMGDFVRDRRVSYFFVVPFVVMGPHAPMAKRPPATSHMYFQAKKATDAYGNWISYTYKEIGMPTPYFAIPGNSNLPNGYGGVGDRIGELMSTVLLSVKSSDNRVLNFNYYADTNRLKSVVDGVGRTVTYVYKAGDARNSILLSRVINAVGDSWRYTYGSGLFQEYPFNGAAMVTTPLDNATLSARKLIGIQRPSGGVTSYTYTYSNLWRYRNAAPSGESRTERIASKILSTGQTWSYQYGRGGYGGTGSYDTTDVSGPDGVTRYEYYGPGYLMTASYSPIPTNGYWLMGRPKKVTYPNGDTDEYSWAQRLLSMQAIGMWEYGSSHDTYTWAADLSQLKRTRTGANYITTFSKHDAYGNPAKITESGPNGGARTTDLTWYNDTSRWVVGKLMTKTDGSTSITASYDYNGQISKITRDGVSLSYTYDSLGNVSSETLPENAIYTYTNYKLGTPQNEVQPDSISVSRIVDDVGNIISETDGEGFTTRFTYDAISRVTSVIPPVGAATYTSYTPSSMVQRRGPLVVTSLLDGFGRVMSETKGGITITRQYDGYGRLTFESDPDASTGTKYQYDALGRVVRLTHADKTSKSTVYGADTRIVTDELGNATGYKYRGYGDPREIHLIGISLPESAANISIARDGRDQVVSVSQGGITRSYSYNSNGYLASTYNPEVGLTTYGRDLAGRMTTRKVGASGVTNYAYNGQGRLISISYPEAVGPIMMAYNKQNRLVSSISPGGRRVMSYDAVGRLLTDTLTLDRKSFRVQYGYDENGNITEVTYPVSGRVQSYTVDVLGRTTSIAGFVNDVQYWSSGQLKSIRYANGVTSSYGQNSRLWMSSFKTQKSANSEAYFSTAYTYDSVGNLLKIEDAIDGRFDRNLSYDKLGRLVGADAYWGSGKICYDGVGNIVSQVFGQSTLYYSYDSSNKLVSTTGMRASNYKYDAYGNVVDSQEFSYIFDWASNLICVNCDDPSKKIEYSYDGLGRRSSVSRSGVKTYEMYDGVDKPIINLSGDKLTEFIYLGNYRIAQKVSP